MAKLSKEDKRWRAESDARTLMEAEAIKSDTSRRKAALGAAKQIVKQKQQEVNAAKKVVQSKKKR